MLKHISHKLPLHSQRLHSNNLIKNPSSYIISRTMSTQPVSCVLLYRPSDHHILLLNNLNQSDSLYSKSLIPFSFWGFPFLQHEKDKSPALNEILEHNQIQIEPTKDRQLTLVDKITTPNFVDSVYDVSFFKCLLEDNDKLIFPPSHNNFSYHALPAPQLLKDFQNGTLHLPAEVTKVLRDVVGQSTTSDLDLEFSPQFHCFPIRSNTIPPFKTTNLIVVVSQKSALIADPGANQEGKDEFVAILQKLRKRGVNQLQVFITHHHKDHWEGLPILAESGIFSESEITIVGHPLSMEKLEVKFTKKGVDDGDVITVGDEKLQVIGTPGHTDNSLSLFHESTRTLVAGDHIVGMGSAVLDFQCGNMKQYFESTKKMIELNPRVAYPAHGPPSFNPVLLLQTYLKHRQAREDAILAAYNLGKHTPDELVKAVYSDVPEAMWPFAKSNITLHLNKLKEEGKIESQPSRL